MTKTTPNSADIDKWLRLKGADCVGSITFARLLKYFGSVDAAIGSAVSELTKIEDIGPKTAERIAASRNKFDTKAELELAEKLGIWVIHLEDSRYPTLLKRVYDPPPVLYIKGTLDKCDNLAIAIVGSRRCSLYGQEQASRFAHLLASAGFTIVSGLARGIDTAAHHGALVAGGRTIAVQGCGLANIYPPENKKLFGRIAESGACVSELPLKYEPLAENFPPRNRIIAGLSLATIVVEAAYNSGALITARSALDNNREVMAVPGKIDSHLSRGTNRLIKQGAKLVESVEDITEALGHIGENLKDHITAAAADAAAKIEAAAPDVSRFKLNEREKAVYNSLDTEPLHIDQLVTQTRLNAGAVNAALVSLQLKGLVKNLPGNMFVKR